MHAMRRKARFVRIIINLLLLEKLTESHRIHISVMPSAEGTSSLIWYLCCERLISGVTSQPLRTTEKTGWPRWSLDLYAVRLRSRHTKKSRLKDFSVKRLGLEIIRDAEK